MTKKSLSSVTMCDLKLGQIIEDEKGHLYTITRVEIALPGNNWSINRKSEYDIISAINPDGRTQTITKWIHRSGKTAFDKYLLTDFALDSHGIQTLLERLQSIQTSQ